MYFYNDIERKLGVSMNLADVRKFILNLVRHE